MEGQAMTQITVATVRKAKSDEGVAVKDHVINSAGV